MWDLGCEMTDDRYQMQGAAYEMGIIRPTMWNEISSRRESGRTDYGFPSSLAPLGGAGQPRSPRGEATSPMACKAEGGQIADWRW